MPWSNPGPARQVLIVGPSQDLLVYDGNPFPGAPYGTLIAALSGVAGQDQFGNTFFPGLSLQHGNSIGVNFSISFNQVDAEGALITTIDGLLKPHVSLLGPGLSSPKSKLDLNLDGGSFGDDQGHSGFSFSNSGAATIFTKSGTTIFIGGTGQTIQLGGAGTGLNSEQHATFSTTFTAVSSVSGTLTFPNAFAAAPVIVGAVQVGSNLDVLLNWQVVSATQAAWRLFQKGGVNVTGNVITHWIAFG